MPRGHDQIGQWFDEYGGLMLLYARQYLPDPAASDLVQDVFLRLLQARHRPENVKAWLLTAVRNAALNELRSGRRREKHQQAMAQQRPEWFAPSADEQIDAQSARAAMETLPPAERELLVLRIWGQMSFQEIAQFTGQAASTVFEHYRQALETLRQKMEAPCHRND